MRINEIFDTNIGIKPEHWQQKGRFLLVSFKINEQGYIIQIERKPIEGITNAVEISFFRSDVTDSEAAFSTTNDQKRPINVYGIVLNAVLPMIKNYDAMLVTAERRHSSSDDEYETKIRIYNTLVDKMSRQSGVKLYTIPKEYNQNKKYTQWLVSNTPPSENSPFKDEQKLALEFHLKTAKPFIVEEILKKTI